MKRLYSLVASAAFCATALSPAFAQGSDACATPTPVVGNTFAYNNATATQGSEGQGYAICNQFGTAGINHDVWFTWTAPTSNTHTLSVCGSTSVDTKIAIYDGSGCPTAPPLACNDDACGLQTTLTFTAVAGNAYTFQVGTYPGAGGGPGTGTLSTGGPVGCAGGGTGPDVIVGDVSDVANYGAASGVDAISLGTTSCNIGTQNLAWQASNPLHPVIGGALYRYSIQDGSGRFEQIGMSWLKHGFAALSGSLCCPCQGGGGSALGVGCSDPYGAGLNGSQPGLGPRWQVNAHTGVFTYPPANPAWSGQTARRLEFAVADVLTTPGTRYMGETQYVTQDDAAAGNQNNNTSCRELVATGGGTSFALLGPTRRTMVALRAWAEFEPDVTITDVQVPGDGHLVVGSKATDLGGGIWHYEFAVYNQNADRNGGSFRVPLPAGASVQNIGFHDITYRNGDGPGNQNYPGTDWTAVQANGGITWECETQAVNPNANAIRWSTAYNFRFDADVVPGLGNVNIGLWKPGLPASMNASAQVPTGGSRSIFAICFGDGSGTACPCGNNAPAGSGTGCLSSLVHGGLLGSSGTPSVSNDTFTLHGSEMPNSSALYFQGTQPVNAYMGAVLGDGLRCAGGFVSRLGTKTNAGGLSQYPVAGDAPVSVNGFVAAGDVRFYQCWYRNSASYCTPDTFNLTNGLQATWLP